MENKASNFPIKSFESTYILNYRHHVSETMLSGGTTYLAKRISDFQNFYACFFDGDLSD